jgi:hypothetical protein
MHENGKVVYSEKDEFIICAFLPSIEQMGGQAGFLFILLYFSPQNCDLLLFLESVCTPYIVIRPCPRRLEILPPHSAHL